MSKSPKIFISYRRGGVKARTYRMADELKRKFGDENVFLDVDSIGPGVKFADSIRTSINSSSVILIMIGPKWLHMTHGEGTRRLEQKDDHLRIEIETALQSKALVIPVLVDGATMPEASELPNEIAELAELNAYSLSDSHWSYDVKQLIQEIDPTVGPDKKEKLSIPGVISLILSALVLLMLLSVDYDNVDLTTYLLMSITALYLSVRAYRKLDRNQTTNRTICIIGMVLGALFIVVSLSEYESFDEPYDELYDEPYDELYDEPYDELYDEPYDEPYDGLDESTDDIMERLGLQDALQVSIPNLSGAWVDAQGEITEVDQRGESLQMTVFDTNGQAIGRGVGSVTGTRIEFSIERIGFGAGRGTATVSPDGQEISGNVQYGAQRFGFRLSKL